MNFKAPHTYLAAGLITGIFFLFIPLLRNFHWESAVLAGSVICFLAASRVAGGNRTVLQTVRNSFFILIGWSLPLLISDLATGCYSFHGLGFWLLIPFPSMFLGISIGRLIKQFELKRPVLLTCGILLILAAVPVIIEFLRFPQLYFFNHVWGYWPGPIYDETITMDSRFFFYRMSTLAWGSVFWFIPSIKKEALSQVILVFSVLFLIFFYSGLSDFGIISPEKRIQKNLGSVYKSAHFKIYYTSGTLSEDSLKHIARVSENYLNDITEKLDVDITDYRENPIHSYLYKGKDQKKKLTGAGKTSFVPVWLSQDQMHIAIEHLDGVLKHEMVHVVAKQFANSFGASLSIGLVEGLAVALDPDRFDEEVSIDQVVAARSPLPGRKELEEMFSFSGFYKYPGIVSYTVTGSFVNFLVENRSANEIKEAYQSGNISRFLDGKSEDLVTSWHRHLQSIPVDSAALALSEKVYTAKSIFEKKCPRVEL